MTLRLGTRGSELARTQSGLVADALRDHGHAVELVTIRSEGDVTAASLVAAGGLGVFAAALRRALLDGEVDLAVHSLKDLPTAGVPGLVLAAIAEREDAADVLCARHGHTLASLPAGARVGTGSPRRAAQVRARRVRTWRWSRSAATWARVSPGRSARRRRSPTWTPSCWLTRGWPGSADWTPSPTCSTCCLRPDKGRWPSSAGRTTP